MVLLSLSCLVMPYAIAAFHTPAFPELLVVYVVTLWTFENMAQASLPHSGVSTPSRDSQSDFTQVTSTYDQASTSEIPLGRDRKWTLGHTLHPTSHTLHPAPSTLRPPPSTLHPPPSTFHLSRRVTQSDSFFTSAATQPNFTRNLFRLHQRGTARAERCSRDTYPESYIPKYTSIRGQPMNLIRGQQINFVSAD